MTTIIGGSSPSITFSDSTTQTTAFTSTPSVTSITTSSDASISGLTVGKGGGAIGTNTAVGVTALAATNTGNSVTAVGYQAANANTSGVSNVAIGTFALNYNTTGGYNTAVGSGRLGSDFGALGNNTSGSYNTALGVNALQSNTTGSNNTAVGYQAGYGNTTDSNNTYIGYTCGSSVTGAGNVMFGASTFAGYGGSNQVACKVGNGREAFYADINAGASFRQYSNSSTWATTSDQRVKENIVEITNGLEKIVALRPVTFDYITSKEHNAGFIAQDFQNVLPDQVKKVKARPEEAELVGEDEIYSIQQNLVPYLVNAIKDLKVLVDAQAAEIAELKAKVA